MSAESEYNEGVKSDIVANDLNALHQAVSEGLGIAYLPRVLVYDDLNSGKLTQLLTEQTAKRVGIYAVYPKMRTPDTKLKLLIEHLRQAYLSKAVKFSAG